MPAFAPASHRTPAARDKSPVRRKKGTGVFFTSLRQLLKPKTCLIRKDTGFRRCLGGSWSARAVHALWLAAVFALAAPTLESAGPRPPSFVPVPQATEEEWDWGTLATDEAFSKGGRLRLVNNCKQDRTITVQFRQFPPPWQLVLNSRTANPLMRDFEDLGGGHWQVPFRVRALDVFLVDLRLITEAGRRELGFLPADSYDVGALIVEHQGSPPACLYALTHYLIKGTLP